LKVISPEKAASECGEREKPIQPLSLSVAPKCEWMRKFQEIDTNKDGQLDRVELTSHAVKQFLEMDTNKDRFLTEEEFKKAQADAAEKMRLLVPPQQPAAPPRPTPAPPQPAPAAPQGPQPGLPQRTR